LDVVLMLSGRPKTPHYHPAVTHDAVPAGLAGKTVVSCLFDFVDLKIRIA
jgi:hypothetical protein